MQPLLSLPRKENGNTHAWHSMIVNHSDAGDNNCDLVDSGAPNGGASLVQGNKGQDEEQEGEQEHGDEKVGEEQDGEREVNRGFRSLVPYLQRLDVCCPTSTTNWLSGRFGSLKCWESWECLADHDLDSCRNVPTC